MIDYHKSLQEILSESLNFFISLNPKGNNDFQNYTKAVGINIEILSLAGVKPVQR